MFQLILLMPWHATSIKKFQITLFWYFFTKNADRSLFYVLFEILVTFGYHIMWLTSYAFHDPEFYQFKMLLLCNWSARRPFSAVLDTQFDNWTRFPSKLASRKSIMKFSMMGIIFSKILKIKKNTFIHNFHISYINRMTNYLCTLIKSPKTFGPKVTNLKPRIVLVLYQHL